jgi:GntR family transcriptional regulator, transcriptional repressor for pyruvate dehydrogenase complex
MDKPINNQIVLKAIERVPLTEVVAESILSLINEGALNAGDKLPSQRELGEMLKVSRPCLREALSGLVMMGYIEARAGQGFYVKKTQIEQTPDFSSLEKFVGDDPIRNLYEARSVIEPKIAAIAAQRASDEDIDKLYDFLREIERNIPSIETLEKGLKFHQLIARAAGNPVLEQIENTLLTLFSEYNALVFTETPTRERDVATHLKIVQMIDARNHIGAAAAALEHLQLFAREIGLEDIVYE